jgi:hypothetical protein
MILPALSLSTQNWDIFQTKLALLVAVHGLFLAITAALAWSRRGRGKHEKAPPGDSRKTFLALVGVYALLVFPLSLVLGLGIYQSDEGAYLFEGHILSAGGLTMPAPPPAAIPGAEGFEHDILLNGKWFGKFPVGWPVVLAIASMVHLEWIVNPLLGGVLLWLTYRIGMLVLSPAEAVGGVFLLVLSPFFIANCLGFMPHPACSVLSAAAVLCYFQHERSSNRYWLIGMLLCVAVEVQMRQFTAMCVASVLGAGTVWRLRKDLPQLLFFIVSAAVLGGAAIATTAVVNHTLIGDYFKSPYALTPDGTGVSVRPADLLRNARTWTPRWVADTILTSFPFLFVLAAYGLWRRRSELNLWILATPFVVLVIGHMIELYDSDSAVGGRYYLEGFFGVALVAAAGWRQLVRDANWSATFRRGLFATVSVLAAGIVLVFLGWEVELRWPTRQLTRAMAAAPCGVVFLPDTAEVKGHRYNINRPDSRTLYLLDTAPDKRDDIAKALGQSCWATLTYDPASREAQWRQRK